MKLKRLLFPYLLTLALALTVSGLLSANKSFSAPLTKNDYSFNLFIEDVKTNNIDVIGYDGTNISYVLLLDEFINNYSISFNVVNDSDFNAVLTNSIIDQIPEELKDVITYKVDTNNEINRDKKENVVIEFSLKDNLTNNEVNLIKKYSNLKINTLLNYNQE